MIFSCIQCNSQFEKDVKPETKRLFCGRSCQMKHTRNSPNSGVRTFICLNCGLECTKYVKASQVPQFCSKSCASKTLVKNGQSCMSPFNVINNQELVEKLRQDRSEAATKRNVGNKHSFETKEAIAASCFGIPNVLKGKTFVEFYGSERATESSRQHSLSLKNGFLIGRIRPSHKGKTTIYKGVRLRSLLELHAIQFLEQRDGLEFGVTLIYEDPHTYVQWHDVNGIAHLYIPDLHDTMNHIVYEVKPAWQVASPTDVMVRKALATSKQMSYRYITDVDISLKSECKL